MVARGIERYPDFVIYSDASATHARIAAALFRGGSSRRPITVLLANDQAPTFRVKMFRRGNLIYGFGDLALLSFIFRRRNAIRNSSVNAYLDEYNGICALIRGDINTAVIVDMAATFGRVLRRYGFYLWIGRVGSKLNISDRPTRTESYLPYEVGKCTPFSCSNLA